ncbi:hypothetical protein C8R44DRAFT_858002 [Mycena epipterygia]|nr:hypothetical protein C8R44DRAFT_858002 [Mycena epipterygia]
MESEMSDLNMGEEREERDKAKACVDRRKDERQPLTKPETSRSTASSALADHRHSNQSRHSPKLTFAPYSHLVLPVSTLALSSSARCIISRLFCILHRLACVCPAPRVPGISVRRLPEERRPIETRSSCRRHGEISLDADGQPRRYTNRGMHDNTNLFDILTSSTVAESSGEKGIRPVPFLPLYTGINLTQTGLANLAGPARRHSQLRAPHQFNIISTSRTVANWVERLEVSVASARSASHVLRSCPNVRSMSMGCGLLAAMARPRCANGLPDQNQHPSLENSRYMQTERMYESSNPAKTKQTGWSPKAVRRADAILSIALKLGVNKKEKDGTYHSQRLADLGRPDDH